MPANFSSFVSQIRHRGVARPSHFTAELVPPPGLSTRGTELELIPLFCEATNFPEMALATQTVKDAGLNREVVYDKLYGSVQMTFICDQQMILKQFFDAWAQLPVLRVGGIFAYPDSYVSPYINLFQVDAAKNEVYCLKLNKVYPKVVNDIGMSASSRGYSSFTVQFTHESWQSYTFPNSITGTQNETMSHIVSSGANSASKFTSTDLNKIANSYGNLTGPLSRFP